MKRAILNHCGEVVATYDELEFPTGFPDPTSPIDPRVAERINALELMIGEKAMPLVGMVGGVRESLVIPFDCDSARLSMKSGDFVKLRTCQGRRVSYWIVGKIGGVFIPYMLQKDSEL